MCIYKYGSVVSLTMPVIPVLHVIQCGLFCVSLLAICNYAPLWVKEKNHQSSISEYSNWHFYGLKMFSDVFVDLLKSSSCSWTSLWTCVGHNHIMVVTVLIICVFIWDILLCISMWYDWACVCVRVGFSTGHVVWGPQSDRPQRYVAGPPPLWPPEVWTQHSLLPTSSSCL